MRKTRDIDNFRQKAFRLLLGLLLLLLWGGYMSLHVRAEEADGSQNANVQGNLMAAAVDTIGRGQPSENAASVVELPVGTHLFVVGEETDGWYEIYYQGKTAYVPSSDLTVSAAVDTAALEQEMQKIGEEDSAFIESLEMQRKAVSRSMVWRIVIVSLMVLFFITGIISALKGKKISKTD